MWKWFRCRINFWGTYGVFEEMNIYTQYTKCHGKCAEFWHVKAKWRHHHMWHEIGTSGAFPYTALTASLGSGSRVLLCSPSHCSIMPWWSALLKTFFFFPSSPNFSKGKNFGLHLQLSRASSVSSFSWCLLKFVWMNNWISEWMNEEKKVGGVRYQVWKSW